MMTKIPAIDRINLMLDSGTFREMDSEVSQSVISGTGKVNGRDVCIYAQNSAVKGGSLGKAHARRIISIMEKAFELGCPIIAILDSGGARIQEGVDALHGYGEIFRLCARARGKLLQIGLILGPCAGGAAYSPALMDLVFTVRGLSKMFINGPAVIKSNTGEDVSAEDLGGAQVSASVSGNAHFIADSEEQCISDARQLMAMISAGTHTAEEPQGYSISADSEIHTILSAISDGAKYMEVRKDFAPNCVTAFARIGGQSVGIVANNSAVMNGDIDIDAADKIADFVKLCSDLQLPIITLVDIRSFKCSREQENRGLIRHGARIIHEYSVSTVRKITVILRPSLGGGYVAMGSKSLGADAVLAWHGATIAVMKPEAAVAVIYKKEIAANPEMRELYLNKYKEDIRNIDLSNYVDKFIKPEDTRKEVMEALDIF